MRLRSWLMVGAVCALSGCGGSEYEGSDEPLALSCSGDSSEALGGACVRDDDCPCASHCDLGVCARSCSASSECAAGERCDGLGRCRPASDQSDLKPAPESAGSVELVTSLLLMGDAAEQVDFSVLDAAVPRLRAVAGAGYEVSCTGAEGAFARHCEQVDLGLGAHQVHVRGVPGAAQGAGSLQLISDRQRLSVSLSSPSASPLPPVERPGSYRGTLRVDALGAASPVATLAQEAALALSTTATIHPDGGGFLLAIDNASGVLGADARWVARLVPEGEGWRLEAPTRPALSTTAGAEVVSAAHCDEVRFDGALTASCRFELSGLYVGELRGLTRVSFGFAREGDLPAGASAPSYPADVTPAHTVEERLIEPLPWEARVHEALSDPFGAPSQTAERVDALKDSPLGLWQCESERSSLEAACESFWTLEAPLQQGAEAPCRRHPPNPSSGEVVCKLSVNTPDGLVELDRCAVMAARYHCTPADVGALGVCRFEQEYVHPALTGSKAAAECPQAYLCWEPPAAPDAGNIVQQATSWLDQNRYARLGDLRCQTGALAFTTGLTAQPDQSVSLTARGAFEACANDLDRHLTGPQGVAPRGAAGLVSLTGSQGCYEPWRLEAALGHAFELERQRALGNILVQEGAGSALGLRLLYQHTEALGLVAREALESDILTTVLALGGQGVANDRTLDEYLELSVEGWSLLLHPRQLVSLLGVPNGLMADPDYRKIVRGGPLPQTPEAYHNQGLALPVVMAETVGSQLEAARRLVNRARFAGTGEEAALGQAGQASRAAWVVLGAASATAKRSEPLSPGWWARWEAARYAALSSLGGLVTEMRALRDRQNPLGIDEGDLPIYFMGDEVTPSQRFSAISDYLIGKSISNVSQAWAPAAVTRAESTLEAAREAWTTARERELAAVVSATDADRRVGGLESSYGAKIVALCGRTDWSEKTILSEWTGAGEHTPATCFIDSAPSCAGQVPGSALEQVYSAVTPADVGVAVCTAAGLRRRYPAVGHPNRASALNQALLDHGWDLSGNARHVPVKREGGAGADTVFTVGSHQVAVAEVYQLSYPGVDPLVVGRAVAACVQQHPKGRASLPTPSEVIGRQPDPECFLGGLGDAHIGIVNATRELDIAREEMNQLQESFAISMESCRRLAQGKTETEALEEAKNGVVTGLRAAKLVTDILAVGFKVVLDADESTFQSAISDSVAGAGVVITESISLGLAFAIETTTTYYDQAIGKVGRQTELDRCFIDARSSLVGSKTAALKAEKAAFDTRVAMANYSGLAAELDYVVREGQASVATERARMKLVSDARRPLANERWVSEPVSRYHREFRLAQRMLYLSVRAVEYEYQVSLPQRAQVLAAQRPAELRIVLDDLLVQAGSRRVNGSTPSSLVKVVSLKQELLKLADRETYTGEQRFAHYLASGAAFNHQGEYLGVEVPFRLVPQGSEAGPGEVPVFAAGDCAERLWSVSASVVGRKGLYRGADPPSFVRMDLRQSNTFFSQVCGRPGETQLSSVRPGVNLFLDPSAGQPSGVQGAAGDPRSAFSTARMRAFFDVKRADLERDEYSEGSSAELAARGLYGDYKLFIPAGVLSQGGSNGLVLDAVEDVLLRLEYVSVAK